MHRSWLKRDLRPAATPNPPPSRRLARPRTIALALAATLIGGFVMASPAAATTPADCVAPQAGGPMWVDAQCVDPQFNKPVIDSETDVTDPYVSHVVSGHFDGTSAKFNIYLPAKAAWEGRFFHNVYPVGDGNATPDVVQFGNDHGAYTVQTGGTSGYRADAATAKFARTVAARYYGVAATTINGYIWGGSGGSYQVVGAVENTSGVWQGAVPFVIAAPTSIPNNFFVRLLARYVLGDKAQAIADAVRPGGSGDPYAVLTPAEQSILREVSSLGVPLRTWDDPGYLFGAGDGLLGFAGTVRAFDPTYADDFWTKPGYLGTEQSAIGDRMRALKVEADASIAEVTTDASGTPTAVKFDTLPNVIDPAGITYSVLAQDGSTVGSLTGTLDVSAKTLTLGTGNASAVLAATQPGAIVRLDNRWAIALASYHRHQVPADRTITAWSQFINPDGSMKYPQRAVQVGPIITRSVTGGAGFTGALTMKTILVANTLDPDAFPWQADWYAGKVKSALGSKTDESFRIWVNDNADHLSGDAVIGSGAASVPRATRLIEYTGILYQAILDVADWVERGKAPASSTAYTVQDQQVSVSGSASRRGGIQPTVDLTVKGGDSVDVRVGQPVRFTGAVAVPPHQGTVVRAEWDYLGTGQYVDAKIRGRADSEVDVQGQFTFTTPGTYFVVLRATAQRDGDRRDSMTLIENLDRVRVVVH